MMCVCGSRERERERDLSFSDSIIILKWTITYFNSNTALNHYSELHNDVFYTINK